ncbi:hypothetical protein CEP54_007460 [Fusarium duplospermum]|uniref:Uncharacterized protein n=1 Tax=Fusarium duplospermum TaxID=1325734 RepID=A0A428Q1B3_9HYPO|nr:hypothetical protein CEP54_007460 [Fusarium duplospermum]
MMNAGSVTTAIALTNALYQLIRTPRAMALLREELDAALEPDEVIAPYDKVKHLPYLRACLDESLRLFPPTHGLPRKTSPDGLNVMGHYVPGNTTVSISALVAHRDESVFHGADQYIPERFLGEKGKALQSSFIAFSAGSRGCIGRNISYLEQTVLIASLVQRYEFELPRGFGLQREETMNHLLKDMPVRVWRRDDSRYDALLEDLTTWTHSKPDSFTPIFISQPSNGQLYPEIWVYNESVAAGLQHYHLARILLLSHNPTIPKIGSAKTIAKKKIDREIRNDSNIICGIAESISQVNAAHIIACMAIVLAGDLFQHRNEQESLFHILAKTTKQYGWPTSSM